MSTTQHFTETKLEEAMITLLGSQGDRYTRGTDIRRSPSDVLIRSDLRDFLTKRYANDNITEGEIDSIIRQLDALNAADLYDSKPTLCVLAPPRLCAQNQALIVRGMAFRLDYVGTY